MKFSYKILLSTIVILAAAFGTGGYVFIHYVFQTSMEREVGQAMDESSILQFAFETAALNIPSRYDLLQDKTIEQIGGNLENGGQEKGRLLRISNEEREPLFASEGFVEETDFLEQIEPQTRSYQIIERDGKFYIQTGTVMDALDRVLYLETMRDMTEVFEERSQGFAVYRNLTLLVLLCSSIAMFFVSTWLTRPIRLLTRAANRMTEGEYDSRAQVISKDEMGQLTRDFNQMASALEENIHKLQEEVRAREDFIAAFSHELKTPLTSIIGYADLLRSRRLDEEKHFLSANYIYTEGKRLESMSFRLLDIIVAKRCDVELQRTEVETLFQYMKEMTQGQKQKIVFDYDTCVVIGEVNLLKSVLLNLVDNACKASEQGGCVEVSGKKQEAGYRFTVRDYGVGIPPEECRKITEAFYMVDKSRARSRNGAGLGLALCTQILQLHHSSLDIESTVGEGSSFSFVLKMEENHEKEKV